MAERAFFVIDRTKLKEETDELRNAIVVYMPKSDLKKASLEQRCSQLVGISILVTNLTGSLPKFVRLKSLGFAIRRLGQNYMMGLSSRLDEPHSCVIQYINHIHSFFKFYYDSPAKVMESSQGDWEIFTKQMESIFQNVLDFTFREKHSLPAMFSPLPYVRLDTEKGAAKLFLKSQRLLRHCQLNSSIIGGCLFYKGEVLSSQLPPVLLEKLLLVANDGVQLNNRSVLEDKIAPESVWLINIFLTKDEMQLIPHLCPDHQAMREMFALLRPNPGLSSGIILQQKAIRSHLDRSSKHKKAPKSSQALQDHTTFENFSSSTSTETAVVKDSELSASFTASNEVSPMKKVWSLGRTRALGRIHNNSLETNHSGQQYIQHHPMANRPLPDLPPDLPSRDNPSTPRQGCSGPPPPLLHDISSRGPPIPSHKGSEIPPVAPHRRKLGPLPPPPIPERGEGTSSPPPIPERGEGTSPPPIPSRGDSAVPPPVPLRKSSTGIPPIPMRENVLAPPPVPVRESAHRPPVLARSGNDRQTPPPDVSSQQSWIYDDLERDESSVPLEFRTPSSSIVAADTSLLSTPSWDDHTSTLPEIPPRSYLDDSDSSDGYATPSPTFPTENYKMEEKVVHSPGLANSQSFKMPLEGSVVENHSDVKISNQEAPEMKRGISPKMTKTESLGEMVDSLEQNHHDCVSGSEGKPSATSLPQVREGMETPSIGPDTRRSGESVGLPSVNKELFSASEDNANAHYGQDGQSLSCKKISQCSMRSDISNSSSLVITQAISEYGSVGSLPSIHVEEESKKQAGSSEYLTDEELEVDAGPGNKGEERRASPQPQIGRKSMDKEQESCREIVERALEPANFLRPDGAVYPTEKEEFDGNEEKRNFKEESMNESESHSPTFHDISGSTSEGEDILSEMADRKASTIQHGFPYTLPGHGRGRADTWLGRKLTLAGSEEHPLVPEPHDPPLVKKCLYVQKCVNTVVAILADESLPQNHQLIKDLWMQLITHLVQINNSLENCVADKEPINTDYGKVDSSVLARSQQSHFHAVYSTTTGMCAVSSPSAPYQFRHAVRRAHQEYNQQSTLRQVSLCKEHCKMICQNILGREQYFQPLKAGPVDSLAIHAALERGMRQVNDGNRVAFF